MADRLAHYVISTHWDREWWMAFQDFRFYLVQLMDRVIDRLDSGTLKGPFHLDGQALIVEDYLEIRPGRRAHVADLIKQGKLEIGPWYVLPDEFAVSGESIVRNLKMGRDVSLALGAPPSTAGYLCDMFGHNSQMPQILTGFGIRAALIWRGINTAEKHNYIWTGPDGTEMPTHRFGIGGYGSYAALVRRAGEHNKQFDSDLMLKDLRKYIEDEADGTDVDPILLLDSCDHLEPDQQAYEVILQQMKDPDVPFKIVHTRLDEYIEAMASQVDKIQNRITGELRVPGLEDPKINGQSLIPGILSSRIRIKQANSNCQTLLCSWTEPFSAFASALLASEYPQGFLTVAWRWLLKNHPHDSICGCSIDQVHNDMVFRFDQCRTIADRLTTESITRIAAAIDGKIPDHQRRVVLFNPSPQEFSGVAELDLEVPADWPTFNEFFAYEPKPALRIYDSQGREIPYQRLSQAMQKNRSRKRDTQFPQGYVVNQVKVALKLAVPALGYTQLIIQPDDLSRITPQAQGEGAGIAGQQSHESLPTRHPEVPGLAASECSMENDILSVRIESNGTISLTDKRSGRIYSRLLTFEDCADIGDGWYHGLATNDQIFTSTACQSDVSLVHNGPCLTTFRIRTSMNVPQRFRFDSMTRSNEFVPMVIDSYISLRPGQDFLDVTTVLDNTARDHRVRVLLPTGADATTYLSDSPFDVVERPIALRKDNHLYRELEVETKPQQTWTAVFDKKHGLAVVSDGLLESAVRDLPERPIALTLLRGTRRTVGTDGEPGGQCAGSLTFRYQIVPLQGTPDRAKLCAQAQRLSAGLRTVYLSRQDVDIYRTGPTTLPATASFLSIQGQAVLTSLLRQNDAFQARLFNPNDSEVTATINFDKDTPLANPISTAQYVDLKCEPVSEPFKVSNSFDLKLRPKQIVTIRLS